MTFYHKYTIYKGFYALNRFHNLPKWLRDTSYTRAL